MKIAIISHTAHYQNADGEILGWGPTVREINYLSTKFDSIHHVGVLHKGTPSPSFIPYSSHKIIFVPLSPSGGKRWIDKLFSLFYIPETISKIGKVINQVDAVQIRVPTGFANYLFPWLCLKKKKVILWVKYAGDWNKTDIPSGFAFQRWWLRKDFLECKVTMNGNWPDQPPHCLTFENPCLDDSERIEGLASLNRKNFLGPYTACFIGRLEKQKGILRILNALPEIAKKKIDTIHFIGSGINMKEFENLSSQQTAVKCFFHGPVKRESIPDILKISHFILLPSDSEGFPKVIAEGANYGAIPIVSNVGSIGQYINEKSGFVWNTDLPFNEWLESLEFENESLKSKALNAYQIAEKFTFLMYYNKLKSEIFNDH